MASLQSRLVDLRELRNLSQAELAQKLHLGSSIISKIENGTRKVSSDELAAFASFYGLTADYLLGTSHVQAHSQSGNCQDTDLKDLLDFPSTMATLSFGGVSLTEEEKDRLTISLTQIFWDRLNLKRMPMRMAEGDAEN